MLLRNHLVKSLILPFVLLSFVAIGTALGRKANRTQISVPLYRDGVYEAKAPGFVDDITVSVKIHQGLIESVKVIKHNEDHPRDAIRVIPHCIVKHQGVEDVEAVTSATYTSNGIIEAVKKTLETAQTPSVQADSLSTRKR